IDVKENSPFYAEAQSIINDILVNSGDYSNSLKIMESLPRLSDPLKSTYQSLSLKHALIQYQNGEMSEALKFLNKSLQYTPNRNDKAHAQFWLSEIYAQRLDYQKSIQEYKNYFTFARNTELPEEASPYIAHYN